MRNLLKTQSTFVDFILKEWLLITAGAGLVLTSVYAWHLPDYSIQELQVLFILFALFVAVNGLQHSGFLLKIARSIEKGRAIPLKLVVTTYFLSMLVTNDIALIVLVPLTLSLNINHKDILVIFETLAANAGSALTPFGNPQNLFIYWYYQIDSATFIETIAPFSFAFLAILITSSLFIKASNNSIASVPPQKVDKKAYIYGILLFIVLLTVLHILPVSSGFLIIFFALLFDRKALRVDYALLFSFFFFFGLAENIKLLISPELNHSDHVFLFSALTSQLISNVPATLLFAKFTTNWDALLWGASAGGFGSLLGSFANLIAYKIYISHESTNNTAIFTAKFILIGYIAFFLSIALYFCLHKTPLL